MHEKLYDACPGERRNRSDRWAADRRSWENSRRLKSDRGDPAAARPRAQYLSATQE